MANRILWINPLGTNAFDEGIHEMLIKSKEPETEITVVSLKRGPQHVEYHFYDTLVVMDLLDRIREAEEQGFSAAIIGCFYDPGVRREWWEPGCVNLVYMERAVWVTSSQ